MRRIDIREALSVALLVVSSLVFLLFSTLLAISDGVIIRSESGPFEAVAVVVAVGFVALAVDRLVAHFRGRD